MANAKWSRGDHCQSAGIGTFSNGDLTVSLPATGTSKARTTARTTKTGKYYVEITPVWSGSPNAEVQVGIKQAIDSIEANSGDVLTAGVACGFNRGGTKASNGITSGAGAAPSFDSGDVIGLYFDLDNDEFFAHVGGVFPGSSDPETRTDPMFTAVAATDGFGVVVSNRASGVAVQFTINTGDTAFAFPELIPAGYTEGLPEQEFDQPSFNNFEFQDEFNGTNGTDVTAHSPDVGGTWAALAVSSGAWQLSGSGQAFRSSGAPAYFNDHVVSQSGGGDATLHMRISVNSGTWNLILVGAKVPGAQTYYRVEHAKRLRRVVAGSSTSLGTDGTTTLTAGEHTVILHVHVDANYVRLRVYFDGVMTRDFIDTDGARLSSAGELGMWNLGNGNHNVMALLAFDGFTLDAEPPENRVSQALSVVYRLSLPHVEQALELGQPIHGVPVAQELEVVFGSRVNAALSVVTAYMERVSAALEIVSPVRSRVNAALEVVHPIRDVTRVQRALTLVHSMAEAATVVVTSQPSASIGGEVIPLEAATVEMDEGDLWRCRLTLTDPLHYGLFNPDAAFTLDLGGEEYAFIVDSVAFERAGQVSMAATVAGVGPGAVYASPRAAKLSRTWDAAVLATVVVEELFGVDVVDWRILNWSIPANKLAVENQAPMDVLKRIAESPGAVTEAEPDGELYVRYLFPVSVQTYPSATADQEYNDTQHNFTTNEQTVRPVLVNKLRILDAEQSSNQDAIEFEQDAEDPARGELKVFPSPWRDSVTLEHTGDATRVSASVRGIETEELTETVEVIGGKGSVSKPIHSVVSLEWKTVNLTGVTFEADSNEFTTTHATLKESLLEITYLTRFIAYDAAAYVDAEVQFLVREAA